MATIRKRGNKYQVQIRRNGQRQLTNSFALRKDAEAWARQMDVQADRNELPVDASVLKTLSLGDLVVRYRDTVSPRKKNRAWEEIVLNAFLRHPICTKNISKLTSADFAAYRDDRLRSITAKSLRRLLCPIHNMFEIAQDEWGLPITENPLDKVKLKALDNRRERRLKEGELERITEACSATKNPYILPIILFALETAMRRGEILSLTWDHVDMKRLSVTIYESKNGYSRTIPLTQEAYAQLQSIEGERELIFPVSPNALRLSWERIRRRADIPDLHFHDLRHEAISRFFELGLTVPEVASISGHRDMRMLFRYAHARHEIIHEKLARRTHQSDFLVNG